MRRIVLMILAAMAVNLILIGAPQEEEAAGDAKKWLALLDDHKYEESWTQASEMFRSQVSQEQWIAALKRSREPLGSTVSRTRTRLQFSKTLRGAPDADYAILHFETSFGSKTGTERLTLVKEDGKWKMVAFGIY